VNLLEIFRTSN